MGSDNIDRILDSAIKTIEDNPPETIDMTPTWEGILPGLLAVIQNGETFEARHAAEVELRRMAQLADKYVAAAERIPNLAYVLGVASALGEPEPTQTPLERANRYVAEQKRWIAEHGGTEAGYVALYGAASDPWHYGDGGEAIWLADMAELQRRNEHARKIEYGR